jgi:hypothetical protein
LMTVCRFIVPPGLCAASRKPQVASRKSQAASRKPQAASRKPRLTA